MAYYESTDYYEDDHGAYGGEYPLTPYSYYSPYDSALVQDSEVYTTYKFNEDQLFGSDPSPYLSVYDPVCSCSTAAYSAYSYNEPKYIQYDPYLPAQTHFIISYSVSEFNVPEFEDYDPTPYDGGYDPAVTYGKPLPPSDDICYPRSVVDLNPLPSDDVSNSPGAIIVPSGALVVPSGGKEEDEGHGDKPHSESEPTGLVDIGQQPRMDEPLVLSRGEQEIEEKDSDGGHSWSSIGSGYGNGVSRDDHEYDGKIVPQIPSGYGLEAMDLCESLFGYWPCLSRIKATAYNNDCQEVADSRSYDNNQWVGAADYLFGSSQPYGERSHEWSAYGTAIHGYQMHYQEQPLQMQLEYVEDSWLA